MRSKEALEELVLCIHSMGYIPCEKIKDLYSNHLTIIKQDLERVEQLEDNIKIHKGTIKMKQNQIESLQSKNEKLENVIELLKDKEVDVCMLLHLIKCGNDTPQYYNESLEQRYHLTQEEYDLLKEYLK